METVLIILLSIVILLQVYLILRKDKNSELFLGDSFRKSEESIRQEFSRARNEQSIGLSQTREEVQSTLGRFGEAIFSRMEKIEERVESKLTHLQQDNSKKLDEMRSVVEEKLQSTLEKRLGESFKLVSGRLEEVQRGLGEMAVLAQGVGDLKRVLTNVKARGG